MKAVDKITELENKIKDLESLQASQNIQLTSNVEELKSAMRRFLERTQFMPVVNGTSYVNYKPLAFSIILTVCLAFVFCSFFFRWGLPLQIFSCVISVIAPFGAMIDSD